MTDTSRRPHKRPPGRTAATTGEGGDPSSGVDARRSARKRSSIIEAATALFLQNGYQGTSMDDIAGRAAVSKQTVYSHFDDKERLFTAIVLETLDRAGEPFRAEIGALTKSNDLAADLPVLARHYLASVMQPAVLQLRRLVIGEANRLPALARAYYERAPERTIASLAAAFDHLAGRGQLHLQDPMLAAGQFAFLVLGRALDKSLFFGDRPFPPRELTTHADAGARAFLAIYA